MVRRLYADEESLMEAFSRGEEMAFDQMFRDYFLSLSFYAFRLIGEAKEAEDIVQDCFVNLWERRRKLAHVSGVKSYLYTAIRYRSMDYLKRRKMNNSNSVLGNLGETGEAADAAIIEAETAEFLFQLLTQLPPRMQEVIRLYYLEGKSYKEIGEILRTEPETVRNQRFKALAFLRKRFIPD